VLPGVSGPELHQRLVARRPGLKVLYMSGYADEMLAGLKGLAGGGHFLQKPFSPQALAQKVREALGDAGSAS